MGQQAQSRSQYVLGPGNAGDDTLHYQAFQGPVTGWIDKNTLLGGVSGVTTAINGPATLVTISAAATTIINGANGNQLSVNLPGGGAYEQVPFKVTIAGYISAAAGTYTSTIQPLIYASTTPGFTAVAANAIYSAAAVTLTMTQAAASLVPYRIEANLIGDSVSGKVLGFTTGVFVTTSANTGLSTAALASTAIANPPTSVTFSAAIPLQFGVGIVVAGTQSAGSLFNVGTFAVTS